MYIDMHPKTAKMYSEAGIEPRLSTADQVKANFDRLTKGSKRKDRKIDQIYIVRRIEGDYIVYDQTIIAEDFPGNEVTCFETVGYHDEPQFQKTYDPVSGEPKAVAVAGNKTVYDIPATKENILKILNAPDVIPTNTNLVLDHNNVKYGGFTMKEFTTKSFDDLMFKCNNGYYPRDSKPIGEEEGKVVQQLKKDLTTTKSAMEKKQKEEEEEQVINEGEQPNQKELEEQVRKEEEKERVAVVVEEEEQQQKEREDKPRVNTSKSGRFNKKTR